MGLYSHYDGAYSSSEPCPARDRDSCRFLFCDRRLVALGHRAAADPGRICTGLVGTPHRRQQTSLSHQSSPRSCRTCLARKESFPEAVTPRTYRMAMYGWALNQPVGTRISFPAACRV